MQPLVAHCALAPDYCGQVKPPSSHFHIGSPQSLIRRPDKTDEQRWGQGKKKPKRKRWTKTSSQCVIAHFVKYKCVFCLCSDLEWLQSLSCLHSTAGRSQHNTKVDHILGILPMGDGRSESLAPCFHIYLSSPLRPRHILQNGRIKAPARQVDADKPESVCCWQQSRFAERDLSSPEPGSAFSHSVLCDEIGFFCVSTCVLQLWQILATCVPLNGTVSV